MIHHRRKGFAGSLLAGAVLFLALPPSAVSKPTVIRGSATPTVSVFSMGFNNPRGLKFGPDGMLYVAEGGTGGSTFTSGCDQVPGPVGPYSGSPTGGRISRVDSEGNRTTVTDQLPSSNANPQIGGDVEGVSDVAFMGNTLYALVAGGGCSHGVRGHPNGIYRIGAGGSATLVANLSAFLKSHPVANPFAGDFEPDGTPYSMIAERGSLYLVEPNHGELDRASPGGTISRVVDISASQGHIVPASLASHGVFYVGNLNTFPIVPGSSKIMQITPSGQIHIAATGLSTVLGVAFDNRARMYALEMTATAGLPAPGAGAIVRIANGQKRTLVSGLDFPTAMTFGPDGALYVSVNGLGPNAAGGGEVLRIRIDD
jgi:hypothetical protein